MGDYHPPQHLSLRSSSTPNSHDWGGGGRSAISALFFGVSVFGPRGLHTDAEARPSTSNIVAWADAVFWFGCPMVHLSVGALVSKFLPAWALWACSALRPQVQPSGFSSLCSRFDNAIACELRARVWAYRLCEYTFGSRYIQPRTNAQAPSGLSSCCMISSFSVGLGTLHHGLRLSGKL